MAKKGEVMSDEYKRRISLGNKGKRLGKTWEEIFGKDRAASMRVEAKKRCGPLSPTWGTKRTTEQIKAHADKIRGKKLGPLHHNWKGGKGYGYSHNVSAPEWVGIRNSVYARDNWRCGICGKHCGKGREIQCHHIHPFLISGSNDMDNLITLCVSCHRSEEMALKEYRSLLPTIQAPIYRTRNGFALLAEACMPPTCDCMEPAYA